MGRQAATPDETGARAPAEAGLAARRSEIIDEIVRLASAAEPVFASHVDLRHWLDCVVLHRLGEPSSAPCDAVSAAACAVRFGRECPRASTPSEFDKTAGRLSTARLEALLMLELGGEASR